MIHIGVKTGVKTGALKRNRLKSRPLRHLKVGAYEGKRNY